MGVGWLTEQDERFVKMAAPGHTARAAYAAQLGSARTETGAETICKTCVSLFKWRDKIPVLQLYVDFLNTDQPPGRSGSHAS